VSPMRTTWEVARWEFLRFFKPRQMLVGMLLTLVGGAVGWGVARIARDADPVPVAVAGDARLAAAAPEGSRLALTRHAAEEFPALVERVERGELAGAVLWTAPGEARLVAGERPRWRAELEAALSAGAVPARFAEAGVDPGRLGELLAPVRLEVEYVDDDARPRPGGEMLVLGVAVLLLSLSILTGMGYIFASITGEKQNRVTEQVVAAIPPQVWMDGKILGISAVTIVNVAATGASFALAGALAVAIFDLPVPTLPRTLGSPAVLLGILVLTLLGFAFWFSFLALVAATIDDPNHSARGGLLMLPMFSAASAFLAFANPDGAAVRALSLLPPLSATLLPARMLLAPVPAWEVLLGVALLAAAAWGLRRAAGKVFHLGMLMYGKEPTWAEIRRWIREA
jgi:ABC-2 type transport system permease protein